MKSIVNKVIYSLGGTFNIIGKELGHIYKMVSYAIAIITGKSMSVNDTIEAPMRITLNPTAISQTTYTGKNLLNIFNVNSTNSTTHSESGNTLVITSTSANANCYISYKITNVLPDTIYTISGSAVSDNTQYISIRNYKTGGGYGVALNINNTTINSSFTTTSDVDYLVIFLYSGQSGSNGSVGDKTTFTNLQLEKSSSKTSYEPYVGGTASPNPSYPQDIHTISGNNSVVVEGKNLFDGVYANAIVGSDGKYTDNNTTRTAMIEVEPNTTYSIKKFANTGMGTRFLIVESATKLSNGDYGTYIYSNISTTEYTHTTGNNIKYLYIYVTNDTTSIPYLMVVKGSTIPTTYTPYVSQTAPINLGTIEYCKIGDYEDKFIRSNDGTWQLEKNIQKITFDGTETWLVSGNGYWYYTVAYQNILSKVENSGILSNCFIKGRWETIPSINTICQGNNGNGLIGISKNSFASIEDLVSFTTNSTVIAYGTRTTPTYTKITGELAQELEDIYENATSYDGQTNISQINNDLPFELIINIMKKI